jgi:predicted CXXCH cytochrome family protein
MTSSLIVAIALAVAAPGAPATTMKARPKPTPAADACVACHLKSSPSVVADWKASRHNPMGVGCIDCHGDKHSTAADAKLAAMPTPETCAGCHEAQVAQFKKGKHAFAWAAVKAMPTFHYQALAVREGEKGCGGCHKLGLKTEAEAKELREVAGGYGVASCDACHTRHLFSKAEARQPEACKTCHMGFDHPQWEMYDSSKHGVRHDLKRTGTIPATAAAPTCQTCHMQEGNHEVRTAWGFLAVRLPFPDGDKQWTDDRVTILQGLGVLDPKGQPTARLAVVKGADVARLTQESFDAERNKMLKTCAGCHSASFASQQLKQADGLIRDIDHLMAEAIRVVAGLYEDGTLKKPATYAAPFPDLLTFHDSPTPIENRLFVMFLEHRMRAFQGAFHANPDYVTWYGWAEMQQDLTEIKAQAEDLRRARKVDALLEKAAAPKK